MVGNGEAVVKKFDLTSYISATVPTAALPPSPPSLSVCSLSRHATSRLVLRLSHQQCEMAEFAAIWNRVKKKNI